MQLLKEQILKLIENLEGEVAVYIKDICNGEIISIKDEEQFHAASMVKIPILWECLRQVEEGILKLTDKFEITNEDKVGGCGILSILHRGAEVTLEDLLCLMIDISDNTATNMLIDILSKDKVNDTLMKLGINNTHLARKLMVSLPGYSYTTARDIGILFEKLLKSEGLKETSTDKAVEILLNQQLNDRLSRELKLCGKCGYLVGYENTCFECGAHMSDVDAIAVKFAHKTGEIVGVVHDGGIMYIRDKRIVVAVLTKNLKRNLDGHNLLAAIGLSIYKYYNQ